MTLAEAPPQPLYHSERGLYDFQARGVAQAYLRTDNIAIWDTGIGKTHLAMATASLLFEDDLVDLVLVVCEKNKVPEWIEDLGDFTRLRALPYKGGLQRRQKIRDSLRPVEDRPQVLIGTYETFRNDLAVFAKNRRKKPTAGPLLELLLSIGARILVVYDEVTKLKGRGSLLHRGHGLMIEQIRKDRIASIRLLGLTATPIESDPEDYYNLGRLFTPSTVGTVASFDDDHVLARDIYDNAIKFKNLGPDDHFEPEKVTLVDKLRPVVLRKRKTDPDVINEFPKQVEEFTAVTLTGNHLDFYETVKTLFRGEPGYWTVLRQISSIPAALIGSQGGLARAIVDQVGEAGLLALGSAKNDRLAEYLETVAKGQGAQVVIFTFFGQSILPLVADRLREEDYQVSVNHGGLSEDQRQRAKGEFRSGDTQIFLSSDAGSRGLNLQNALYVVNYEMPLTYARYRQRADRINRIDSIHPSVTLQSFFATRTVEEDAAQFVFNRNEWDETMDVIDDEDPGEEFLTAAARRGLLRRAKARG